MKIARWKVVGLAGALALGYVASADAAQIKVDENTWADFGLNMKIWYYNKDKRAKSPEDGSWTQNVFDVGEARLYFEGQITPLFQFYNELTTEGSDGNTKIDEGGINLAFAKEFQVLVGKIRKPFTRAQISSEYDYLTPQGYWLDPQGVLGAIKEALDDTDTGVMVHGDLFDGLIRYRIGMFNEDRSNATKWWKGDKSDGWTGFSVAPGKKMNDKKNFEWNARIEFTPPIFGFKPESAATITAQVADTYLGSKDVFTIGFGYHYETHTPKGQFGNQLRSDLTRKGWTVDAMFEKKFGCLVPNLQVGYINFSDSHYYNKYRWDGTKWDNPYVKKGDSDIWYVTGQLLYDQVVWLGKPAIAFRYENITGDGEWTDGNIRKKDLTVETYGVALNYYIKGQAARISVGFDYTKYDDALKRYLKVDRKEEDSITDWYVYFQSQF